MKKLLLLTIAILGITSVVYAWTLRWDESTGTVDGYIVEISLDKQATWPYIYLVTDSTSLPLDDKCQYNQTYDFRVSAYNAAGVSNPCEPLTWQRPAYTPPVENPLPEVNEGPPAETANPNVQ